MRAARTVALWSEQAATRADRQLTGSYAMCRTGSYEGSGVTLFSVRLLFASSAAMKYFSDSSSYDGRPFAYGSTFSPNDQPPSF
mmetsp:Transcript_18959/g.49784  ORF Transcript_18959/g.49784 Transcript_18959/m.49784 type:complete len:84 (-) Transcript_18959:2193-2444(-)